MTDSRRTFFKSLAKAAAIVALAPQLAFRVRPEVVAVVPPGGVYVWTLDWTDLEMSTKALVCREHGFVATTPHNPFL